MKKCFTYLFILLLLSSPVIHAQGIYQLWGMTPNGGSDGSGAMFSMDSKGDHFFKRHDFKSYNQGANPVFTDPIEFNGKFYGMTSEGGGNDKGVIFEWDPATNSYTKKIDMNTANGSNPQGSLTLKAGKFYGMTISGGSNDAGVIFEWDPATNIYTKKIDLISANGSNPTGSLTLIGGSFYGMTTTGGITGKGVIFKWDPTSNIYTKKRDLDISNGSNPYGDLTFNDGKLYGMTSSGGDNNYGVIFEWDPVSDIYLKKIDFDWNNGRNPWGRLTFNNGKFYGMTKNGGIDDKGVIFEWDPVANICTDKIDFDGNDGRFPKGNLTLSGGKFYGITTGSTQGQDPTVRGGGIFEWDPVTNQYTKKIDLSTKATGNWAYGSLTFFGGKFYGMTQMGGSNDNGVIFEWEPATNQYATKIDFNGNDGLSPRGALSLSSGKYYGISGDGGSDHIGLIFEWNPSTDIITKKIQFDKSLGGNSYSSLIQNGGKFYGMTKEYGLTLWDNPHGGGSIFQWDPVTNNYTKIKYYYGSTDGYYPYGNLTFNNGKIYGMTNLGGSNFMGVIFELDPVTNDYIKKIDFNGDDGSYPFGSLTFNAGKFYGFTQQGGINDKGVIFEWDPATNIYTKKIDLGTSTGCKPLGSLVLINGKFYGLTEQGGTNDKGVIFEWDPTTNIYTKKIDFTGTNGSNPAGSLTFSNGKFYGMTNAGGSNNAGLVFEWDPVTNIFTKKKDLNGTDGANPELGNDLSLLPAPVAKGVPGTCTLYSPVIINNSNNNIWVPIIDEKGDAIAEIKANGNNLGIITTSMYINNGAVREDGAKRLYLDRNLTITPELQPTSAVDIRLYIKSSEYLALKNAVNSVGQPSGVSTIDDVSIYKNYVGCSAAAGFIVNPVATTAGNWEQEYVLSASINSFSSFYFSAKAQGGPLPVTRLEFNGYLVNNDGELNWKTTDEFKTNSFDLERSTDGISYKAITNIVAVNQLGIHQYNYSDKNIISLGVPVVYYRLKQKDQDGRFTYSGIIALSIINSNIVLFYPNPVTDKANLIISIKKQEQVLGRIIDNTGRILKQLQWNLPAGSNLIPFDVSMLANGIYYLDLIGETIHEHKQFIKQ